MPPQPNNNQAATTDYGQAYNEFDSVYAPQVQQVQGQLNEIPGQTTAALSSLDQAKANAFKSNTTNANARGVLFGGVVPQANTDYTTNTYNPNVQKVNDTAAANTKTLQQKITDINQERANAANTLVLNTQDAENKAAAAAARTTSGSSSGSGSGSSKATASLTQGSKGQYMYVDPNGKTINMEQYIASTGGDINSVLGLLQNGTSYDKAIYNKVVAAKPSSAAQALSLIHGYDTGKYYGF